MIKAVIFDFGRVISAPKPPSLFRRYEEDLGLEAGTINTIMFDSPAWQDALTGRKTVEEFWSAVGPRLGLNSPQKIDAFRHRYHRDEAINPGILPLLCRLHGRLKLAVLSNSPPGLEEWLREWKMRNLFDVVFCSGDEGLAKPDSTAFHKTLERLGVNAQEAVFIDDTLEHVQVARVLGLQGILFSTIEELSKQLAWLLGGIENEAHLIPPS
jgi:HAD superfamily hydrolase (TIGR01509 family)